MYNHTSLNLRCHYSEYTLWSQVGLTINQVVVDRQIKKKNIVLLQFPVFYGNFKCVSVFIFYISKKICFSVKKVIFLWPFVT